MPAVHEAGAQLWVDAPGTLRQAWAFRHDVQPGEQGDAGVGDVGHDMRRPSDPPELQRQQGPEGMARRNHRAARHVAVGDDPIEIDADEIGYEQEQSAEAGAQTPRRQVEFSGIGGRSGIGPQRRSPLRRRTARQLADAVPAKGAVHARRAGGHPLLFGPPADFPDRKAALSAKLQDAPLPPQPERLIGVRLRPAFGEEASMLEIKPGSGFFSVFSGFRIRLSRTFPQRSPQAAPSGHAGSARRGDPGRPEGDSFPCRTATVRPGVRRCPPSAPPTPGGRGEGRWRSRPARP